MLADDLRHALDPAAFAREVLGFEPDRWQASVLMSASERDLLNCSRQAGKSTVAAILGLHQALYRSGSLTLLVSPSLRQSAELFRKVVDLRGRLSVRATLMEDNKLSMSVRGGGRVVSLPGSESTIRGFSGASLLVIDEASRVEDALYHAVTPMLATTRGRLIAMSTPFGRRGWWAQAWLEQDGWVKTKVTVHDVPRIDPGWVEEEKGRIPAWWFEQEYLCQFKEATDAVFTQDQVWGALSDEVLPLFGSSV